MTEEIVHTHTRTHSHFVLTGGRRGGEVTPDCCQSSGPVGGPRRQADRHELWPLHGRRDADVNERELTTLRDGLNFNRLGEGEGGQK